MNIAVRGIGIISALGNGAGETLAAPERRRPLPLSDLKSR